MDLDKTFCVTTDLRDVCANCVRHINHDENKRFKDAERISTTRFEPRYSNHHGWHCDYELVKGQK